MPRRFRNCIGPQIRKFRLERGLTQDQLAARLQLAGLESIDRVSLAKIESQLRSAFDYEVAVIARVLGVELDRLMPSRRRLEEDLKALIAGRRK